MSWCGRRNRVEKPTTFRPATSYGGALGAFDQGHLTAARRMSRISARHVARARTRNELRACDTRRAQFIRAGRA